MKSDTPNPSVADMVQGVDGYYVYYPPNNGASYSAHALRIIAGMLDQLNKDWDRVARGNKTMSECPKCGCQVESPFPFGPKIIHDVARCGGRYADKEKPMSDTPITDAVEKTASALRKYTIKNPVRGGGL